MCYYTHNGYRFKEILNNTYCKYTVYCTNCAMEKTSIPYENSRVSKIKPSWWAVFGKIICRSGHGFKLRGNKEEVHFGRKTWLSTQ